MWCTSEGYEKPERMFWINFIKRFVVRFCGLTILFSGMTSHYVMDQSMIIICDVKKMLEGEEKQNAQDSTYKNVYLISINIS